MDENPNSPIPNDGINAQPRAATLADAVNTIVDPAPAEPVVPAPSDETIPAVPAEPEEVVEPETTPAPANETPAPTLEVAPAEAPPVEEEPEEYMPPAQQVSPIDPKAFADENGYVDVNKLTEAINQAITGVQQTASATAQREMAAQRAEERLWNATFDKYPDLKTDRSLRDFVQQARVGKATEAYRIAGNDPARMAQIKIPTPLQMASELFKRIGQAKTEGVQSATETTTVAESNAVLPSGNAAPTTSKREELFKNIRSNDRLTAEASQKELLKDLLFNDNR